MPTLETVVPTLKLGPPLTSQTLRLVPLVQTEGNEPSTDYALASEAFARNDLTVTEVDEEGVVQELLAVSTAEIPILLIDGEELVGAKQNRILNTDVLLRARGKVKLPVSCVEQGRWCMNEPSFEVGLYSPSSLRAKKSKSVTRSLRQEGSATSDQGEVWDEVGEFLSLMGASSDTSAMSAAFEAREDDLDTVVGELPCPEEAVGVIAFIDGQFVALDLFDRTTSLQRIWNRLVAGYAADALAGRTPRVGQASEIDSSYLLKALGETEFDELPGTDLGSDCRFESGVLAGSALVYEGRAIHVTAFPNQPESDED